QKRMERAGIGSLFAVKAGASQGISNSATDFRGGRIVDVAHERRNSRCGVRPEAAEGSSCLKANDALTVIQQVDEGVDAVPEILGIQTNEAERDGRVYTHTCIRAFQGGDDRLGDFPSLLAIELQRMDGPDSDAWIFGL